MDIDEIHHRNILFLREQLRESGIAKQKDQAMRLGLSASYFSQLAKGKVYQGKVAREIEEHIRKPNGWLDSPQWGRNDDARPVAVDAAQPLHPPMSRTRRVEIRGNVHMDKDGFWKELDDSNGDEWHEAITDDPNAYALRIMGRRYSPAIESGWCILLEPSRPLKVEASVLVSMRDGRRAVRKYLKHDRGLWAFMSVLDSNDILELPDSEVVSVHRITNRFETD